MQHPSALKAAATPGLDRQHLAGLRKVQLLAFLVLLCAGWAGCRCRPTPQPTQAPATPSLRLALVSTVAGALEPCGCVKDMLGGVDHAAAYLRSQQGTPTLALAAGPILFMDPELSPDRRTQDGWKAEALHNALGDMGVRAWAPGFNDFAAGSAELARIAARAPETLAANVKAEGAGLKAHAVYSVGGLKVGVVGVSLPRRMGLPPAGVSAEDPVAALRREVAALTQAGAVIKVALLAMPRGDALRALEAVPEFQVALLGKPLDQGETNDALTPPSRIGQTLVIEGPNHLQALYVVDLFVRDGSYRFENAGAHSEQVSELDARIAELSGRLVSAERQAGVRPEDLASRRQDLAELRGRRAELLKNQERPQGSYYEARSVLVREELGKDQQVEARLGEYYRRVNEHNRVTFADRVPAPVRKGESAFVGIAQCGTCHAEEEAFWKTTGHAHAYETLSSQSKEFNLDCVGCHVTGYNERGGSTVTHVANLKSVQCETCHGPGSRHIEEPKNREFIVAKPELGLCASKCHHPPHVKEGWSAAEALPKILGKGHGR